jgi:predicted porin
MRGSFGQFEIGAMDSAAIKTTVGYMGSWATQVGENSAFGPSDWISGAQLMATTTTLTDSGGNTTTLIVAGNGGGQDGTLRNMQLRMFDDDANKISYYTPRFEGFQIGVSYTPLASQNTQNGIGASELGPQSKNQYHEIWSFGGNFDRKFDQIGVGIAAGYVMAKSPGTNSVETSSAWKNTDDAKTWGIGAALEWGPFKISGGYRENIDVRDGLSALTALGTGTSGFTQNTNAQAGSGTSTTTSLDGSVYDVGARYMFGPNAVSVSYRSGEIEGLKSDPEKLEEEAFMVSYRRTLGPGVNWDANVFRLHTKQEPTVITGVNPDTVTGWAFTTAINLAF